MAVSTTLSVVLVLAAILLHTIFKRLQRQRLATQLRCRTSGPSYPHVDPLFGLDFIYENGKNILAHTFAEGVRERFKCYGTTYSSRMGFQNIIHTINTTNLEAVMGTQCEDYQIIPHRSKLVGVLFGEGIFTTSGSAWRQSRSLVHSSMGSLGLDSNVLQKHANLMIDKIRAEYVAGVDDACDFGKIAAAYTFNVAAGLTFGKLPDDTLDERSQFATDFAYLGKMGNALTIFISTSVYLADLLFWKHFRPAQRRLFNFVEACAKRALASHRTIEKPRKNGTIVEGLAAQTSDIERIRGETLNLFLAGHATVDIALTELLWYLGRSPAAWARLREEVAGLGGKQPTIADLKDMTYLRWTIFEAARLGPTLSTHGRKAVRDTVLPRGGGAEGNEPLLVEKGTYIAYSNYALHRDPSVFGPDVDTFRPERWASIAPSKFAYLPFGAGPRACPGKTMGWTIVAYATVRLAQDISEMSPRPDEPPWQEASSFSFYNRHGVHLRMIPVATGDVSTAGPD